MTIPLFCRMAESVSLRCLLDAQQNEKARMCVVSQSLPALLYVTLKILALHPPLMLMFLASDCTRYHVDICGGRNLGHRRNHKHVRDISHA